MYRVSAFRLRGSATREVFLHQALWGAGEPCVDDQFVELRDGNALETHQDRWVAVEMRGGEIHLWVFGDQRVFHSDVFHVSAQDRPIRRPIAERFYVRSSERSFPYEAFVVDPP